MRVELWVLDLRDKKAHQLTSDGAVNLEPRFSPDGRARSVCLYFLQPALSHFCRRFDEGKLSNVQRLTEKPDSTFLDTITANSIVRSVRCGLAMARKFYSFRIAIIFTALAAFGE